MVDLRTDCTKIAGRCLVGSSASIPAPPAGVVFLLDTDTGMDTALPANVRTFINTQLGINVPAGLTWRTLLHRLFHIDGQGRWGTLIAQAPRLVFGSAGQLDV